MGARESVALLAPAGRKRISTLLRPRSAAPLRTSPTSLSLSLPRSTGAPQGARDGAATNRPRACVLACVCCLCVMSFVRRRRTSRSCQVFRAGQREEKKGQTGGRKHVDRLTRNEGPCSHWLNSALGQSGGERQGQQTTPTPSTPTPPHEERGTAQERAGRRPGGGVARGGAEG